MRILQKQTYLLVLSKEEAQQLKSIDNIEHYYSFNHKGYVFSAMVNHVDQILTDAQVSEVLAVIQPHKTIDISDKLSFIK